MAYIRRPYRGTISVDVEVDINDVLSDIDDDSLREELKLRGQTTEDQSQKHIDALADLFEELRTAIRRADLTEALVILDTIERPKWRVKESCEAEYLKTMNRPTNPDAGAS